MRLSIEFSLAAVMALILYFVAGKNNVALNLVLLTALLGFCLHPALSLPWITTAQPPTKKRRRIVLVVFIVIVSVSTFGFWVWPQACKAESPPNQGKVPSRTSALLVLDRIEIFRNSSLVKAGRKLAFRATFLNPAIPTVKNPCVAIANAVAPFILPPAEEAKVYKRFQDEKDSAIRSAQYIVSDVSFQHTMAQDFLTPPLTEDQAQGILSGKGRLYVMIWAGWSGDDGLNGDMEECFFLAPPKKQVITASDLTLWGICHMPGANQNPPMPESGEVW